MPRPVGPVDRLRSRARARWGPAVADRLPRRYTRLGRVAVVPLPEALRPHFVELGAWYADALRVATVLRPKGPVHGEDRAPDLEAIHGEDTVTEVLEHGTRYRFDAARLLFARGNKTERARIATEVRPGEHVVDLFAGIGYFTLPIARASPRTRVTAIERNPLSFRYLVENLRLNGVGGQVAPLCGDNRELPLPRDADRVLLGYLPSSLPWLGTAIERLGPGGGTLHVHLVVDARSGAAGAEQEVRSAVARRSVPVEDVRGRIVKAYGPGRSHAVVDCRIAAGRTAG